MKYLGIFLMFLVSCTQKDAPKMSVEEYDKNTQLILQVSEKFMDDPDVEKLHKVIVDFQFSRAVTCDDVDGECRKYSNFLQMLIDDSKNGEFSPEERVAHVKAFVDLKKSIKSSREVLEKLNN